VPRQPDPQLEQRILDAACRLWSRGGEKTLTMRGIAKAAGTTTPTLYERYHDRDDILRAVRMQTRAELFAAVSPTSSLDQACRKYLNFAVEHPYVYEVLFDSFAEAPSLHEPWPTFNLMRLRLAQRLGAAAETHAPHALIVVLDARHGDADDSRRSGRSIAQTDGSRVSGCTGSNRARSLPDQGKISLRPEMAGRINSGGRVRK